jgi:phage-related protein
VKPLEFVGSAQDDLATFPRAARRRAGHELFMVQQGRSPADFKTLAQIGPGVCEIRVRDRAGAFRIVYVATFRDTVYVLHAFQKKSQKTSKADLDLATKRYKAIEERE